MAKQFVCDACGRVFGPSDKYANVLATFGHPVEGHYCADNVECAKRAGEKVTREALAIAFPTPRG